MSKEKELEYEFEALFKKNYSHLFYYALDFLHDQDAAEDLVSELFADIWNKYDILRDKKIEAYLYRAIRNKAINFIKHKEIEFQYMESCIKTCNEEIVIEEDIEKHEENLQIIEQTLNQMNDKTQYIFTQCYYNGKKYEEVAKILNLSVSAVHKHISKAMSSFKKAFENKNDSK